MNELKSNLKKYILPSMLSSVSYFVLTIVDGIFVGNGVGTNALGAVSLSLPYVMLVQALAVLFTFGGVIVASVRLGRGDDVGAKQVFMHSFVAIVAIFSVICLIGVTMPNMVAKILGANDTYRDMVSDYIFWYSIFVVPVGLLTFLNAFCRNDGEPLLISISSTLLTCLNIFGDWLLVFQLRMGISGAAIATGLSSTFALLFVSRHFFQKRGQIYFQKFKFTFSLYKKIILRGTPEMISQFAAPITTFSMNRMLLMLIGNNAVNAFSVVSYVGSLFSALMYGVSGGVQPLFGLSYGAKHDKNLKYYFHSGLKISAIGGLIAFAITFFIGRPACVLFGADATAYEITINVLPKYCVSYVFAASSVVISAYLFSTKRTPYALCLNISRCILLNFLCINFLPLMIDKQFVWYSLAVAEVTSLIIGIILWRFSERNGIVYK